MSTISDAIIGQMQSAGQPRVSTSTQTINQAPEGLDLSSIGSLIMMMLMMQDPKVAEAAPGLGLGSSFTESPMMGAGLPATPVPRPNIGPIEGPSITNRAPGVMGLDPQALMRMIMSMGMR